MLSQEDEYKETQDVNTAGLSPITRRKERGQSHASQQPVFRIPLRLISMAEDFHCFTTFSCTFLKPWTSASLLPFTATLGAPDVDMVITA